MAVPAHRAMRELQKDGYSRIAFSYLDPASLVLRYDDGTREPAPDANGHAEKLNKLVGIATQ